MNVHNGMYAVDVAITTTNHGTVVCTQSSDLWFGGSTNGHEKLDVMISTPENEDGYYFEGELKNVSNYGSEPFTLELHSCYYGNQSISEKIQDIESITFTFRLDSAKLVVNPSGFNAPMYDERPLVFYKDDNGAEIKIRESNYASQDEITNIYATIDEKMSKPTPESINPYLGEVYSGIVYDSESGSTDITESGHTDLYNWLRSAIGDYYDETGNGPKILNLTLDIDRHFQFKVKANYEEWSVNDTHIDYRYEFDGSTEGDANYISGFITENGDLNLFGDFGDTSGASSAQYTFNGEDLRKYNYADNETGFRPLLGMIDGKLIFGPAQILHAGKTI